MGFLARAGHLLGRLSVSFGLGGYSTEPPAKYHCFSASVYQNLSLTEKTAGDFETVEAVAVFPAIKTQLTENNKIYADLEQLVVVKNVHCKRG